MYVPGFTRVEDETDVRAMVAGVGSGWLVTANGADVPVATLLPVLWRDDRIIGHVARANDHWRAITEGMRGLLIVTGPQAYVSPAWYPSKAEHGRVVPTWNYVAVQLSGPLFVHHGPAWLRDAVTSLTERHEGEREPADDRWHVTDAPQEFVESQLKGIVGLELVVEKVEAKAKLSQNRPEADRLGVIEGLRREPRNERTATVLGLMERDAGAP